MPGPAAQSQASSSDPWGGLIAVSWVGKVSGAHINPVVTLAFWLTGSLHGRRVPGYVGAQLLGGIVGAGPLVLWGAMGRSVDYGATAPGPAGAWTALLGEATATAAMVAGLLVFLGRPRLRRFTPLFFPGLYALMVWFEAPLSGTSTNPARTLGPAVVSGVWTDWWVYWLGPIIGMVAGVCVYRLGGPWLEVEVAKLYHFEHDRHGVFRRPESISR